MRIRRVFVVLVATFVAGCGTTPAPSATSTPASTAAPTATVAPTAIPSPSGVAVQELPPAGSPLPAGIYTSSGFEPRVVFAVDDGWVVGTVSSGFVDIQQERGTPDVIAVQYGLVDGMVGASNAVSTPRTAAEAAAALRQNPAITVVEESASRVSGLEGLNVTVENAGTAHADLMRVSAGMLGIDPKRRLWVSLFDTPHGILAIMVGGSTTAWDKALTTAEPVLNTLLIAAPGGAASASAGEPVHIALGDGGPIGIDTVGDRAWVVLTDSGELVEVDLATRSVVRRIPIGGGGSQVVASDAGPVYVGKFDVGGAGEGVAVVGADGSVGGIKIGPVGGLALDDHKLWVFQKTGEVTLVDPAAGTTKGSTTVRVDQDAHMDAVAGAGSAWVSGDRTPVHRISGSPPKVAADIETGGGIPLAYVGGLVWGARPGQLWAIDPATNTVTRRIALANVDEILALDVDVDAGEAWIAIRRPGRVGAVIEVDVATEAVTSETKVALPAGVRITPDRVWVTDYEGDDLVGITRS